MPRILRIFNRMIIGGPALNVSLLTKYLPSEYETTLVVGSPDAHEQKADYLLERLGLEKIIIPEMGREISMVDDLIAYRKIKSLIKQLKPDIVHTHTSKPGAIGRWAAATCNVPVIVHTFHGHVFHSYFSPLKTKMYIEIERKLAQKSSKLIAISEGQKRDLTEVYKIAPEEKVAVINLGLDLDPFKENMDQKRKQFRCQFGLEEDVIAIGIIGRLAPIKNHQLFLNAIKELTTSSHKKIKGFIVGDGECRGQLEDYCRSIGLGFSSAEHPDLSQPIIFTSWRTDIDVVNAGLDIITLTSFNEGTPVSIIEAQASSKPIVSTYCGSIADIVLENETALLSPIQQPEQFICNLKKVAEHDDLRRSMSARGANFAFSKFGYHRLVHETDTLYQQLLAQAGR
ncbi:MAG TPA: glycosyltransferase [Phnomibacter sp.]|nr:glycosyltransferase [Phnomibacter sp.]